ncbi:GTPase activating protein 1-like [Cryptomeria japonica]|uniref:GTPase activating protein 1-like n=1 Tax=Cryptomeria japonica TaxID=3369 RepID=UPI0027DA795E|nr:GTPase activating protein 1-like [Cryptomeria japonica]
MVYRVGKRRLLTILLENNKEEEMQKCVKVTVLRGTNLVVKDIRSSDPYVVLKFANKVVCTKVVKKNLNPTWNEEFKFPISSFSHYLLKLEVWDKDKVFGIDWLDPDDFMGVAKIDLKHLINREKCPSQHKLGMSPSKENILHQDSYIIQTADGKRIQEVCLKLHNVTSGLVYLRLEWSS